MTCSFALCLFLFIWVDTLRASQQFFSHDWTFFGLNQYWAEVEGSSLWMKKVWILTIVLQLHFFQNVVSIGSTVVQW